MSATMTIDGLIDALENVRASRGGTCPVILFDAGDCSTGEDVYVTEDVVPVMTDGRPDFSKDGEWVCYVGASFDEPDIVAYGGYEEWHDAQLEQEA